MLFQWPKTLQKFRIEIQKLFTIHQATQITGCIPLWFQCVLETKSYSSQFIFKYSSWALFFSFYKVDRNSNEDWKIRWYFWHLAAVFICCFRRYSQVPGKAGSGHPVRHLTCWFPCLLLWTCCGFILSTCFFRFKYSAVHISLCEDLGFCLALRLVTNSLTCSLFFV